MIAFYTSGHGFGHASRDIEVMNAICRRRPDASNHRPHRRSRAGCLTSPSRRRLEVQAVDTDSGRRANDSLTSGRTRNRTACSPVLRPLRRSCRRRSGLAAGLGAAAVVADVPPLACAAAARAGIPAIVLGELHLGLDLSRSRPVRASRRPASCDVIEAAYARPPPTRLRLPLHGGFAPMAPIVRDIPFVARRSAHGRAVGAHRPRARDRPPDRARVVRRARRPDAVRAGRTRGPRPARHDRSSKRRRTEGR